MICGLLQLIFLQNKRRHLSFGVYASLKIEHYVVMLHYMQAHEVNEVIVGNLTSYQISKEE